MSAHKHIEFPREQTLRMSWFLVILFLGLTFSNLSEASHDKKVPSAAVVGTVYCDTCFQQKSSMGINHHFISGASVAVECKDGNSMTRFSKEAKTNEHGEFKVQLPFSVSKYERRINGCTVKLVSSSEPYCAVASAATSSSLRLKSRKQGEHIFSAGFFSFKPLKQPSLCSQKPVVQNSKKLDFVKRVFPPNIDPSFPPSIQDTSTPGGLPNLPLLPGLPDLPPLTILPPLIPPAKDSNPSKSSEKTQVSDQKVAHTDAIFPPIIFPPPIIPNPFQPPPLIPNPFQPPPLIPNPFQPPPAPLIPNPFQPPPAPLIPNPFQPPPAPPPLIPNPFQPPPSPPPLIPNPFQPPPSGPSPLFPFPPIPGLTPSPPPPPPPSIFPFPLPPWFPPPRSPGNPPASSSENTSP